jgi:cytochrome c553
MRTRPAILALTLALSVLLAHGLLVAAGDEPPPPWAYGFTSAPGPSTNGAAPAAPAPAAAPAPPPDTTPRQVPGSPASFTLAEIRNGFGPADWFPGDHPAMPEIVAHGKRPDVRACSLCHYPNGKGRPENAGVSGLPVSYFIQTMNDFKNGARKSADARKANTNIMIAIAKGMTDEEIKIAADYFAAMPWTPWIKVVETATVPKTRIAGGMFLKLDGGETEPIGNRIIEMPEDTERTEVLRDPRSSFIAYVPAGSIKKGEALVTTGGGKTTACAVCHGADLKGLGPVPGLAGRSPSYTVRQLYDTQTGARKGVWADLMKPVVAKLTSDDMLAIAAYAASLKP